MELSITVAATLVVGLMYASIFEWAVHRYIMHRPIGLLTYAYKMHTKIHHHVFQADESYHLKNPEDISKIHMLWWSGVVVILGSSPFTLIGFFLVYLGFVSTGWSIIVSGVVLSLGYYASYEYLHWCMHLPKERRLEKSRLFRRINGHHILHHKYMYKNYNVVLPFADWLFGTLILRAKRNFNQVRGPSVPDVQPQNVP